MQATKMKFAGGWRDALASACVHGTKMKLSGSRSQATGPVSSMRYVVTVVEDTSKLAAPLMMGGLSWPNRSYFSSDPWPAGRFCVCTRGR